MHGDISGDARRYRMARRIEDRHPVAGNCLADPSGASRLDPATGRDDHVALRLAVELIDAQPESPLSPVEQFSA